MPDVARLALEQLGEALVALRRERALRLAIPVLGGGQGRVRETENRAAVVAIEKDPKILIQT